MPGKRDVRQFSGGAFSIGILNRPPAGLCRLNLKSFSFNVTIGMACLRHVSCRLIRIMLGLAALSFLLECYSAVKVRKKLYVTVKGAVHVRSSGRADSKGQTVDY